MVTRVGHGDASLTTILSRQSASMRAEIERRTTELTTGIHRDLGAAVGGDFSALAAVEGSLSRLKAYSASTTEAALYTDAMQSALGAISDGAGDLSANILRTTGPASDISLDSVAFQAGRAFETAIAALNTRLSDRAIFSGVNSDTPPLPDAETILSALDTATAGAATVADVVAAVTNWFADPAGYDASYVGGRARSDVAISQGESARIDFTAADPAIKAMLQGLATAAMLDRGALAGQPEARSQLLRDAGQMIVTADNGFTQLAARVGTVQAQVAAAQTRNGAEETALGLTRAGMVSADPYDTATALEDLQNRLQSLYLVTSRVSRLTLADYI